MILEGLRANWKPIAVIGSVAVLGVVAVLLAMRVFGDGAPSASAGPAVAGTPSPLAASPTATSTSVEPSATPSVTETASVAPPDPGTEHLIGAEGIAFVRTDGSFPFGQAHLVDANGSVRQLTNLDLVADGGVQSLSWSPDGERLAYAYGQSLTAGVEIIDAAGGQAMPIDVGGSYFWSPDGSRLAVGGQLDVGPPGAINTLPVSVVDAETGESMSAGSGLLLGWHPDGQRVLVLRELGADETSSGVPQLVLISIAGGHEEELMRGAATARWSPDGSQIAYVVSDDPCIGNGCDHILVGSSESGELTLVASGFEPVWSPDGTRLAYSSFDEVGVKFGVVEVATGESVEYAGGYAYHAAWSPDGDRIAYTASSDNLQQQIIRVVEVESGQIVVEFPGMAPSWRHAQ